jgi:hypothetical protein
MPWGKPFFLSYDCIGKAVGRAPHRLAFPFSLARAEFSFVLSWKTDSTPFSYISTIQESVGEWLEIKIR